MYANIGRAVFTAATALSILFLSIPTTICAQPWQRVQAGTTLNLEGVFGADSYSLAVGANGTMIRFDGAQWSLVETPTVLTMNAVWAKSPTDAFVVASSGHIFRYDGSKVTREPFVTSANLRGVWGTEDRVFAVGDNGTVLEYDGSGWRIVPHVTSRRLRAVGSSGGSAAFAVGDHGAILRYDGSEWSVEDTPTTMNLFGVWAEADDNVIAVGSFGTVLRYDGDGWTVMDTPTTLNLTAVWGFSENQIFAVGDYGTILEFDGKNWRRIDNVTTLNLTAINNGFVVGSFGTVLRNPGTLLEVKNLRITEIDPKDGRVEVTNEGPAFTSGEYPLSHRMDVDSAVPKDTPFGVEGIQVVPVSNLRRSDSDLWLYRQGPFDDPNNIIHGVKYGPRANVGETSTAVDAGIWTSTEAHAPSPPERMSLAYDGFGIDPKDWYVDETPSFGERDFTRPGTVPPSLVAPRGVQDFESVQLGDEAFAVAGWTIVNERGVPGVFTARVVPDVNGDIVPTAVSSRWLRIRDQDAGNVENVVATPTVFSGDPLAYAWAFYVNIEELPSDAGSKPRVMIQHAVGNAFVSTWGVEFGDNKVYLVVTHAGGNADRVYAARTNELIGEFTRIGLLVSLIDGFVSLTIGPSTTVTLPIAPAPAAEPDVYRLAYVGSGLGNTATILLDDISVDAEDVPIPFAVSATATLKESDVVLTWSAFGREPVERFDVYRRVDGGDEAHYAGPFTPDARRFEDPALASDHTYAYVVVATRADGSDTRSPVTKVSIAAPPAVVFAELRTVPTQKSVLLLWELDIVARIDGFRVYRRGMHDPVDVSLTGGFLLPVDARYYTDAVETMGQTYFYSIAAVKPDGTEIRSGWSTVAVAAPSMEITNIYPNPFTAQTTISVELRGQSSIDATVYDVRGRRVADLPTQASVTGRNVVTWNGRDNNGRLVSAGTYFVKVKSAGAEMTRKLVIVR